MVRAGIDSGFGVVVDTQARDVVVVVVVCVFVWKRCGVGRVIPTN